MTGTLRIMIACALVWLGAASVNAPLAAAQDAEADLIEVSGVDVLILKDGTKLTGTITKLDAEYKIKNHINNTARLVPFDDVKSVTQKQTPEQAYERLAKEASGNASRIVRLSKEALRRFGGLTPKVIAVLEREAGSKDAGLLTLLCDLYLQTNQNKQAQSMAGALVAAAPSRASSFRLRGSAYLANGNMELAGKDLETAYKLAPDDPQILIARASLLISTGRGAEANSTFERILRQNSNNLEALTGQGLLYLRQGKFAEADKSFQHALEVNPDYRPAIIGQANTCLMMQRFPDACQLAESILAKDPKCGEAYAVEAFAKLFLGDKESLAAAEKKLKESLAEKAGQPRLVAAHTVLLERQAQFEEAAGTPEGAAAAKVLREQAAARFNELAASDPNDGYLQYLIGERRFQAGNFTGAEAAFGRAVQLEPQYAPAHAAAGATALRLGKWEAAKAAYAEAQKRDAASGDYAAGQGLSLLKMQRFEEASAAFVKARELETGNVTALCGLGYIANAAKNKALALEYFQQALALDGNCAYAAGALSKIFAQDGILLEYLAFEDNRMPAGWKARNAGALKVSVGGGQVLFAGSQSNSAMGKAEFFKEIRAEDFVRLEADIRVEPGSPASAGLRVASGTGSSTSFEVEFGKDESAEVKMRFRDYQGQPPVWTPVKTEWPASGKIRLGIETEDIRTGKVCFMINGKKSQPFKLVLQRPSRIAVGFFAQGAARDSVRVAMDNAVLLVRGTPAGQDKELPDSTVIFADEKKQESGEKSSPKDKKEEKNP